MGKVEDILTRDKPFRDALQAVSGDLGGPLLLFLLSSLSLYFLRIFDLVLRGG